MAKINTKAMKNNDSIIVITFTSAFVATLININLDKLNNSPAISFF